jgi:hypothetical protein
MPASCCCSSLSLELVSVFSVAACGCCVAAAASVLDCDLLAAKLAEAAGAKPSPTSKWFATALSRGSVRSLRPFPGIRESLGKTMEQQGYMRARTNKGLEQQRGRHFSSKANRYGNSVERGHSSSLRLIPGTKIFFSHISESCYASHRCCSSPVCKIQCGKTFSLDSGCWNHHPGQFQQ